MSAAVTRRLQELFEKYDTSGDGVLSQEEMGEVLSALRISQDKIDAILKTADANEDGQIQVHEFISWLTDQQPMVNPYQNFTDEDRTIDATITNTSDYKTLRFTFTFTNCLNMEFLEGRTNGRVLCWSLENKSQRLYSEFQMKPFVPRIGGGIGIGVGTVCLGGGFKCFLFSPLFREDFQID